MTVSRRGSDGRGARPPVFFATPAEWRAWLTLHHGTAAEVWVGFHKKGTGRASLTWPEAVDQALCFGWIDAVRKRIDDASYMIRFTPRRTGSTWSSVNIARVKALTRLAQMQPAGLAAFRARTAAKSGIYAYEQDRARLPELMERQFRRNREAWTFFQARPAWYRHTATWWVVSAKQEATRARRLGTLIEDSAAGRTIRSLTRPGKS
ncbi:MAG: YdeI/OmpD-associated family protein [Gemmatimonadales bacterium]